MFIQSFLLSFRLFFDRRVPILNKLIPILATIYLISPLDFLPDVVPFIGVLDDFTILIFLLNFFIQITPDVVLRDYAVELSKHNRFFRLISNADSALPNKTSTPQADNAVIDGEIVR